MAQAPAQGLPRIKRPTMTTEMPEWKSVDPTVEPLPSAVRLETDTAGEGARIVAVVATQEARAGGWAAHVATWLASGWAQAGARVVLADLDVVDPVLHRVVGVENGEGMADAFLFGASMARIVKRVRDGDFLFAPAGTAVPDPEIVLRHERWGALTAGLQAGNAWLVLFLPAEVAGIDNALQRSNHVVLLSGREEPVGDIVGRVGDRLLAVLGPEPSVVEREEGAAPEEPVGASPPTPAREKRGRVRWLWILLLIVLMVLILVGAVMGFLPLPGIAVGPRHGSDLDAATQLFEEIARSLAMSTHSSLGAGLG